MNPRKKTAKVRHKKGGKAHGRLPPSQNLSLWVVVGIFLIAALIALILFIRYGTGGDKQIGTTRYTFADPLSPKEDLRRRLLDACPEKQLCQSVLLRNGAKIPFTYPAFNTKDFIAVYVYDEALTPDASLLWNCRYHTDERCLTALGVGSLMEKYHPKASARLPGEEEIQSRSK